MPRTLAVYLLAATALLLALAVGALLTLAWQSRKATVRLGVVEGRLTECPATPNCVSSDAPPTDSHYIAPIADPTGSKWPGLAAAVGAMDGATLVESADRYLRFTFTTRVLGFVDDVEFHYRPESAEIAVRSASRVGRGDMHANRRRLEAIRASLQAERTGR